MLGAGAQQGDFEVAVDDLQQVVEVVGHAGRELADGLHLLRLQPGFLVVAALGDVHLRSEEVEQFALLVEDGAEEQGVPERRAVGLVVHDVDRHRALFLDRAVQLGHGGAVGVGPLQETAVAAQDLLDGIAGQVDEGAVGEHDRIVFLARIGDQHRHAGHLDRGEEDVAAVLQALALDVAGLPVVDAGIILGRSHRVDRIAFDLGIRRHAAALAAALDVQIFLE